MKKSGSLGSKDGKDVHFEDETCCQATKSWCSRNIIHMILLALAVAAVGGAVIGSLDSCSDTVENITVSREITSEVIRSVNVTRNVTIYNNVTTNVTVKQITPLSVFMLIDASASMVWREDNSITPCPAPATCTGARNYITSDGNAQGINDNTTRFSCRSGDKNLCWPTPTYATGVSLTYDSTQEGDRFDKAKLAFDEILNQLDSALNNGTSNKLRTGVIQWAHDSHGVILESHLTNDTSITRDVTRSMVINGDQNTCWAPGLCQCYSQLKNDPESLDSTKLCILMTDGELYPAGCGMDNARYGANTGNGVFEKDGRTQIATEFCEDLYNDWSIANGGTTAQMSHRDVSTFVKSQNISIYGVGVGISRNDAQDVFDSASCSDYTWDTNDADCPFYADVANFAALTAKSQEIANFQLELATSLQTTTEITTEEQTVAETETVNETVTITDVKTEVRAESVSICSLDFLYALSAFGPFLAYLLYRLITIVVSRKANKRKLLKMLREGTMASRWGPAGTATRVLLPKNRPSDIDFGIAYALFSCCPCLLPVKRHEMDLVLQETLAL